MIVIKSNFVVVRAFYARSLSGILKQIFKNHCCPKYIEIENKIGENNSKLMDISQIIKISP